MSDRELKPGVKNLAIWMLGLALVGLADASYLAANHSLGRLPICRLSTGCANVLNSSYATVGHVPVAFAGSLYYLVLVITLVSYFETGREERLRWAARFTIAGLVASVYLVLVMAVVLKAYCQFCLISAITSILLFVVGMVVLVRLRRKDVILSDKNDG